MYICISYYILYVIYSLNLNAIFLATTLSFAFLILMKLSTEIIIRLEVDKEKNCIRFFWKDCGLSKQVFWIGMAA